MLRKLKKAAIYHYIDGVKTEGAPAGIWGHLTGVTGDLDDCGITEQDRLEGVHVDALIGHRE